MYPKTKRISKSSTEKQNILKTLLGYPFGDSSFQVLAVDPLGIHFSHGTEARIFASICDILKLWLQQCLISECFTYIPCGICCVDIFGNVYIFFVYFWNLLQYLILYVWFILCQCLKIKSCTCERMYLWIFELDTYCFSFSWVILFEIFLEVNLVSHWFWTKVATSQAIHDPKVHTRWLQVKKKCPKYISSTC